MFLFLEYFQDFHNSLPSARSTQSSEVLFSLYRSIFLIQSMSQNVVLFDKYHGTYRE